MATITNLTNDYLNIPVSEYETKHKTVTLAPGQAKQIDESVMGLTAAQEAGMVEIVGGDGDSDDSFKIIDIEHYWDNSVSAMAYKINTPITDVQEAYDKGIPIFVKETNRTLPSTMVEHVKKIYPAWFNLENSNTFIVYQYFNLAGNADAYHVNMSEVSINIETFEYTQRTAY